MTKFTLTVAPINIMKKALRETQTLRAGCSKAEPTPLPTDPLPGGGRDGQNLISWRWSLPLSTNPAWWGSMNAISSYRGNRSTNKQTITQTDRGDYNTLRSLARSVITWIYKGGQCVLSIVLATVTCAVFYVWFIALARCFKLASFLFSLIVCIVHFGSTTFRVNLTL